MDERQVRMWAADLVVRLMTDGLAVGDNNLPAQADGLAHWVMTGKNPEEVR